MTHDIYKFYDIETCGACRGFGESERYVCGKCRGEGAVECIAWSCSCGAKGDGEAPELCPKSEDEDA